MQAVVAAEPVTRGGDAPLVSVIIPTCDRPETLVDAVRSVFAQGVAVEVIVIDDSPGCTAAAAMAGLDDPRIRYVANPTPSHGRPALVRNMGIGLARGRFLHFLDDDDLVPAGYYAAACAVLAARPGVGVVFGTVEPFGADAGQIDEERDYFARARARALRCARWGSRWVFTAAMLFGPTLLVCSAGLVRRELMAAVGGFNPAMALMEDVDFHMRSMRAGGVHFLDRPALRYRIGPSLMRQSDQERARVIAQSYQVSQSAYRKQRGVGEFLLLKVLAKGLRLA